MSHDEEMTNVGAQKMSYDQLHLMGEKMAVQLRALKADLEKANEDKASVQKSSGEREEYLKVLEENVNRVKEEKKEQYGRLLSEDVMPYLQALHSRAGGDDKKLGDSIKTLEGTLQSGLENAFMEPKQEAELRVLHAVASSDRVRSSDLERALRTEQDWGVKYEALLGLKGESDKAGAASKESAEMQEKIVAALRAELDELKASGRRITENINNVEGHFYKGENAPVTIAATASGNAHSGRGIDSLLNFQPSYSWRNQFPDPGRHE